mmetsp:Transcript_4662/g.6282  ORF Transcript_4662/g.6282 Transcript_4662/m.6282 type:complete len:207 (-) Transcript_4662:1895-2515(-)
MAELALVAFQAAPRHCSVSVSGSGAGLSSSRSTFLPAPSPLSLSSLGRPSLARGSATAASSSTAAAGGSRSCELNPRKTCSREAKAALRNVTFFFSRAAITAINTLEGSSSEGGGRRESVVGGKISPETLHVCASAPTASSTASLPSQILPGSSCRSADMRGPANGRNASGADPAKADMALLACALAGQLDEWSPWVVSKGRSSEG